MARIYRLKNYTRRERYTGSTTRSLKQRKKEHGAGRTKALRDWDWDNDKIRARTLAKGLSPAAATRKAQKLEQRKPPRGWKNIQTGGK